MNCCRCQSPPAWPDGGSGRSRSAAAGLSRPGMPGAVLDLLALRPRTVLLQFGLPQRSPAAATPCCQPAVPAESGGPARSSGPAAAVPRAPVPGPRDGSIFPGGHFSGTIRLWRNDHDAGGGRAGQTSRSLAALLDLWPARPLRRSFPTHSPTKVRLDNPSGNPRTDSPLLLRRALENRHHCASPERPPRHRAARH
jgi:hypothetical protein